jgi:ribosomal-protein-alanine N-acetyltransferase
LRESHIVVRRVSHQDLDGISEIETDSFAEPFAFSFFERMLEIKSRIFLIAVHDGELAGYVLASVEGKAGHILSIAVDPGKRRMGIGAALMRELSREFGAIGISCLSLEVKRSNLAARAFYGRMGFGERGILEGYYGGHEDGVAMSRKIGMTRITNGRY